MKCNRVVGLLVLLVAGFVCGPAAAQVPVTPTVKPTPAGQLIVVNNGPGDQNDPHISGNLVVYSNYDYTNYTSSIHYFDLATLTDKTVPNNGTSTQDYLSDVRGTTIVFTRVTPGQSAIFSFDTASGLLTEIAPQAGSVRRLAQIGDQTIAWQDFGFSNSTTIADIVVYDRQSGTTTRLANDSALNDWPGISPDGKVIVWGKCPTISSPCTTWLATLSNGTWTVRQVSSQVETDAAIHPDTDGTIVAYSANSGSGDQLLWQPVTGGTEQILNLQGGQGSTPSISAGLIAFSYLPANASSHEIALYDVANNVLYNLTGDIGAQPGADKQLNDISVTPDGQVRVVWEVRQTDLNIYAYTFSLAPPKYTLTDLGPMQISAAPSGATALNGSGQVAGFLFDTTVGANQAFLWNSGTLSELGTLGGASSFGYGIDPAGQVVGTADLSASAGNTQRAFIWQNGSMSNLGDPNPAGSYSTAFGINVNGDVAGYQNDGLYHPVIWKAGIPAGAAVLTTLPCIFTVCQGEALAINDSGQAAGWSNAAPSGSHAVMWDSSGQPTDLGTLGGTSNTQANGINKNAVVVGYSQLNPNVAPSTVHAFVWQGGNLQDLGAIPGPDPNVSGTVVDTNSSAWGINSKGDIVGISAPSQNAVLSGSGGRAFLNTGGVMYDLSSLLVPGTNWKLEAAWAINDNGQIVGVGFNPQGVEHGYLLTPSAAPTTTALAASVNPSVFGQQVSITATVSPTSSSSFTPGGNVTFSDGSNALQTVDLASGTAIFNTSALAVGSHTITASYSGDTNFNSSSSAALSQTVNQGTTTSTVSASPSPVNPGQPVTLAAIVTPVAPASGIPSGTVTFLDGTTTLGTPVTMIGGQATLTTSALTSGAHSITAAYGGDTNFLTSTSSIFSLAVNQTTTTTLTSSPNPSNTGQSVTLTATVAPGASSTNTLAGTVTFLDGTTALGTGTLTPSSCKLCTSATATFTTSSLTAGTHSLTASYGSDPNFAPSTSSAVTQTVNLLITVNESIKVSDAPAVVPSVMIPVNETISVSDAPVVSPALQINVGEHISVTDVPLIGNTPTGPNIGVVPTDTTTGKIPVGVTFTNVTQAGVTSLTTSSTGVPPPPGFQPGTPLVYYDISTSAAYTGPINICINFTGIVFPGPALPHFFHLENGAWVDHTLSVDPVNMIACGTVTSLSPFAVFQQALIATVTSITAPSVTYGTPASVVVSVGSSGGTVSGSVSLGVDGGAPSSLALTNGSAVFNLGVLNAGPHSLSANFAAQGNFLASASSDTFSVAPAPLAITANNATRPYGASNPAFSANFSGFVNGDNSSVLTGLPSCTTTATPSSPVGIYPIMCAGVSSPNYAISSINGTLSVVPETTSLAVAFSPLSIMVGQSTTATITLTAPDMVIPIDPSGLASVAVSSPVATDILSNNGICTPVPSTAPGVASCTIIVTSVEPNGRTLNASFSGSADLTVSSATADLIVTAALQSQQACIASDFRNVAVPGGSYLWFNSIFKVRDVTKQLIHVSFFKSTVQFQYTDPAGNTVTVNQSLPDAKITIDPNASAASTSFDSVNNVWITTIPWDLDDNSFLTGMPWLVPSAGLPADVEPVTMCGTFASDVASVDIGWRWAAAAYSTFSSDNTTLGVKPMDTDHDNQATNHDHAGTPENYNQFVIPGARGKGGKNYIGTYSRSAVIE